MSTAKLDQSLDDIVKTTRPRRTVRNRRVAKTATAAPAGGITKTKAAKATRAAATAVKATANNKAVIPVSGRGESKIVVTGLPSDVTEQQIKEYFGKTIGPVKRAMLTYGPNGQSRGVATIVFNNKGSATEAAKNLNGVKVDNRAMKIEVIVGADQAPVAVAAKALGDRIAQPKNQNKKTEAKSAKSAAKPATKAAGGRKAKTAKGRATGRGKPKTAEELDAEMTDYFGDGNANGATGQENAVANASGGDAGMEDEIM